MTLKKKLLFDKKLVSFAERFGLVLFIYFLIALLLLFCIVTFSFVFFSTTMNRVYECNATQLLVTLQPNGCVYLHATQWLCLSSCNPMAVSIFMRPNGCVYLHGCLHQTADTDSYLLIKGVAPMRKRERLSHDWNTDHHLHSLMKTRPTR